MQSETFPAEKVEPHLSQDEQTRPAARRARVGGRRAASEMRDGFPRDFLWLIGRQRRRRGGTPTRGKRGGRVEAECSKGARMAPLARTGAGRGASPHTAGWDRLVWTVGLRM